MAILVFFLFLIFLLVQAAHAVIVGLTTTTTGMIVLSVGTGIGIGIWQWRRRKSRKSVYEALCDLKQKASNRPLELEQEYEKLVTLILSATEHLDPEEASSLWKRLEAYKDAIDQLLVRVDQTSQKTSHMNPKLPVPRLLLIHEVYQELFDAGEDTAGVGNELAYEAHTIEHFPEEVTSLRKEILTLKRTHQEIPWTMFDPIENLIGEAVRTHDQEKKHLAATHLLYQANEECENTKVAIDAIIRQRRRAQSLMDNAQKELASVRAYMDVRPADVMQKFGGMYNDAMRYLTEARETSDSDLRIQKAQAVITITKEIRRQGRAAIRRYNQKKDPFPGNRMPQVQINYNTMGGE